MSRYCFNVSLLGSILSSNLVLGISQQDSVFSSEQLWNNWRESRRTTFVSVHAGEKSNETEWNEKQKTRTSCQHVAAVVVGFTANTKSKYLHDTFMWSEQRMLHRREKTASVQIWETARRRHMVLLSLRVLPALNPAGWVQYVVWDGTCDVTWTFRQVGGRGGFLTNCWGWEVQRGGWWVKPFLEPAWTVTVDEWGGSRVCPSLRTTVS